MWPGSVASAVAYRRELRRDARMAADRSAPSASSADSSARVLLVRTSDTSFMRLLPWLMLLAAVTFTFGDRVRRRTLSAAITCTATSWLVFRRAVRYLPSTAATSAAGWGS